MMSLTFGLFTQVSGSGPLGPLVFYGLHVCFARVISKISWNCSRAKYQGMGKYMFTKKSVCFSKMPRQKNQISLHFNLILSILNTL